MFAIVLWVVERMANSMETKEVKENDDWFKTEQSISIVLPNTNTFWKEIIFKQIMKFLHLSTMATSYITFFSIYNTHKIQMTQFVQCIFIVFQYVCALYTMKPLKLGLTSVCWNITSFNFNHNTHQTSMSSNFMSQMAMIRTLW